MKPASRFASVLFLTFCAGAFAHAASVSGSVKSPDGSPFRGAFVQAQNTSTRVLVSVLTGTDGRYRIENLPAGNYQVKVKAVGYKADPQKNVSLSAGQNSFYDFSLAQAMVRWSDLSQYQGEVLFPEAKGKDLLVGRCFACHGFQSRMASVRRDEDGWRDRVAYMRDSMHFFLGAVGGSFGDKDAALTASYINSLFGDQSVLPKSPAEMPKYKELVRSFDDDALKIVYVEYEMPGPSRMPWSAFPDKDGNYWIPYYGNTNKIGRLDPKTGEVQEYAVPNRGTAAIHSAVPAPDGSVWLTEQGSNKLGHWDPLTRSITEYQDLYEAGKEGTVAGGSKHTLRIDAQGRIWATGGPLTMFNPKTQKFTQIAEIPSAYGLALDKDGNCWFAEYVPNGKIGKVDGKTLKVTKWQPPTADARPRRIQIAADGTVWFAEFQAGKIGRFDPQTETFMEYNLPGPETTPYALEIAKNGTVWYSSEHLDVVGNLDPKSGHVTEYPFPQAENTMREFYLDGQGRMWFGTPANNKVGYFYLAGSATRAGD
jgi:virginiamycin B lyase